MPSKRQQQQVLSRACNAVLGRARICIIVGGAFQAVARCPAITGADLVLYLDVPVEIDALPDGTGVITIRLAEGHTLRTLAKGCSEELTRYIDSRPAIDLSVGLGQLPAIGKLAIDKLLADPGFKQFLMTEVFDRLMVLHNGLIELVDLSVYTSTAGATGGPIAPVFCQALVDLFCELSEAVVRISYNRAGSLSFFGVGSRVHINSAAAVDYDIALQLSCHRHAREVRSLAAFELPMVGTDKPARDKYATQIVQAISAEDVQAILNRAEPNLALNSRFGMISIFRAAFWYSVESEDVAREVTVMHMPRLKALVATAPDSTIVQNVEVILEENKLKPNKTIDDLARTVRASGGVKPENFDEDCRRLVGRYASGTVVVALAASRVEFADHLRVHAAMPCRTAREFAHKLANLRGIDFALSRGISHREAQLALLQKRQRSADEVLKENEGQMFPVGFLSRGLLNLVGNIDARIAGFKTARNSFISIALQSAKVEAEISALRAAQNHLRVELDSEVQRLTRIIELLHGVGPGRSPSEKPLLHVEHFDLLLEKLIDAVLAGADDRELLRILASSAVSVTLEGLAAIFGCGLTLCSVATQLVRGVPPVLGPPWAGKRPVGEGQRITVLPPLEGQLLKQLRDMVHNVDPDMGVVCASSVEGGTNAVRLEIYKPIENSEIYTPLINRFLEEASAAPHLFMPHGRNHQQIAPSADQEVA